ncbi:MAG TPA: DUF6702 family protein [Gemmatimonadales bacterium]|nr:DUF6702 family protein [Gemmatimonadales bacterium]
MIASHAMLLAALASTPVHPLHTTLTTVAWQSDHRELEVAVRVFTQDLAEAVTRAATSPTAIGAVTDSAACRYATAALSVRDAAGAALRVARCVVERAAEVTWIRLAVPAERPEGLQLRNAFLFERFADQVNIVQADLAGVPRTLLFTTGDGPQPLS